MSDKLFEAALGVTSPWYVAVLSDYLNRASMRKGVMTAYVNRDKSDSPQ